MSPDPPLKNTSDKHRDNISDKHRDNIYEKKMKSHWTQAWQFLQGGGSNFRHKNFQRERI